MQIKEFSQQLEILEKTSSRNEMTVILADFLRKLDKHEIRPVMYMLIGRIVPTYIPIEFNFSTKLLIRSLAEAFKMPVDGVKKMYGEKGDIGLVGAEMARQDSNKNGANTTINEIYDLLYELAISGGKGSQEIKKQIYIDLIKKFDPISVKFISRIITGDLRLGLSDKTILDAFSWIISGDKSHKVVLEQAYGVRADIGEIAELVLSGKMDELDKLEIVPGTPVASKLVQREKSVDAVFERLGDCYAQPKYDGLRTQIHFSKKDFAVAVKVSKSAKSSCMENYAFGFVEQKGEKEHVRIFSRNMEPLTDMFPDIVKVFENSKFDSIVLDGEAIGVDPKTGKFIAFQETSKRRRKYSVGEKAKSTPVKVFVFDVLCFDGKDLTKTGLRERLEILNKLEKFFAQQNVLAISNTQLVKSTEQLDKIFRDALDKGLEGIIAKDIESKYIPGTRTYDWIKLKANIEQGLIDTVDCVVLGYYYGRESVFQLYFISLKK
ncbi:MAG: putative DNA ligase, partial [candidate division WS6 bacterium GW2011_GWA2_37_6]